MFTVVLFAASLFFAGLSLRLRTGSGPRAVLGLGYACFVGAAVWVATGGGRTKSGLRS